MWSRIEAGGMLGVAGLTAAMLRAAVAIGNRAGAARHRRRGEPRDAATQLDHPRGGVGMIDQIEMLRGLRRLVDLGAMEGADAGEPVTHIEGVGDLALLAVADAV